MRHYARPNVCVKFAAYCITVYLTINTLCLRSEFTTKLTTFRVGGRHLSDKETKRNVVAFSENGILPEVYESSRRRRSYLQSLRKH